MRITAKAPASLGRSNFAWATTFAPTASVWAVLLIGAVDFVWDGAVGPVFAGWRSPVLAVLLLLGVATVYRTIRPVPALAEMSFYAALWVAFSCFGAIATYLAAAAARPLQDRAFAAFDIALHFDWVAWADTLPGWPLPRFVLLLSYNSLMPQLIGSIACFALAHVRGRNEELLLAAAIGLLLTTLCFGLWPALGPIILFGYGALHPEEASRVGAYIPDLLALRHGPPWHFELTRMQGIICLPSYHTVLALLLIHAHRGLRWSMPPVALLNALMLISIPSEGGHYLADMAAGAPVALAAIAAARLLCRRDLRLRAAS